MIRKRTHGRYTKVLLDVPDQQENEAQQQAANQEETEQQQPNQQQAEPHTRLPGHGPQACKRFARKQFAAALPFIVRMLLEKAEAGSVTHLRLFMKLAGLEEKVIPLKRTPKRKSLEVILMEQWEKDKEDWLDPDNKPGPIFPDPSEYDY